VTPDFLGGLGLAGVLGLGCLAAIRSLVIRRSDRRDLSIVAPLLLGFLPIVVLAGVSLTVKPLFILRYLTASLPFVILACFRGWSTVPPKVARMAAAASTLVALALFVHRAPGDDWNRGEDLRAAVRYLDAQRRPGDVVVFTPSWYRMPIARYWGRHPELDPTQPADPGGYLEPDVVGPAARAAVTGAGRVWLVGRPTTLPEPGDAMVVLADDLRARQQISTTEVGTVTITLLGPAPN
jgi:mannosyltransferase